MRFFIVDAFADRLFGGNPAGVVLVPPGAGFPSDETMLRTAAELRYSETAFVLQKTGGGFHLRYFTPTDEVDLCGHATIAAFHVLWKKGVVLEGQSCKCETAAGRIDIAIEQGVIWMDMAKPKERGKIDQPADLLELYQVMGLTTADGSSLMPEMISTGLPDIILPVCNRSRLEHIRPDMLALSALSERYGVIGVHAFAFDDGATAYCRNFAPAVGIPEEAATGTSNGALTYYLYKHGVIRDGQDCLFVQGESMGRPSKIHSRVTVQKGKRSGEAERCKIKIGGTGIIVAEGEIHV